MVDWAILILRLCLAAVFIGHGLQAAFGMFGGPGISGFSQMLAGLGFRPALFWAFLGAYTELVGGIAMLLGLFVRGAAALLLIFMLVAALRVHLAKGFFLQNGGFEYNFALICVCAALLLLGAGKFTLRR